MNIFADTLYFVVLHMLIVSVTVCGTPKTFIVFNETNSSNDLF